MVEAAHFLCCQLVSGLGSPNLGLNHDSASFLPSCGTHQLTWLSLHFLMLNGDNSTLFTELLESNIGDMFKKYGMSCLPTPAPSLLWQHPGSMVSQKS